MWTALDAPVFTASRDARHWPAGFPHLPHFDPLDLANLRGKTAEHHTVVVIERIALQAI